MENVEGMRLLGVISEMKYRGRERSKNRGMSVTENAHHLCHEFLVLGPNAKALL